MNGSSPKQSVTDETRKRVEAAALEAFELYGLDRVRVEDVARIAGVSRPTVYRVFPDREALIDAIFVGAALELNSHIRETLDVSLPLEDALVGIFEATIAYYEAKPHRKSLMKQSGLDGVAAHAAKSVALRAAFHARWSPYLTRARQKKLLRNDLSDQDIITWLTVQNASFMVHGILLGERHVLWVEIYRKLAVFSVLDHSHRLS